MALRLRVKIVNVPSWDIRQIALCEAKGIPVRKNAWILDYGCGAGRRVYELLDAGYLNASGYDVLDYLELRNPADRKRFYIAPAGRIPLPDGVSTLFSAIRFSSM